MILGLIATLLGCGSPKAAYHKIEKEVDAGRYGPALSHVESALRKYNDGSDEWTWRLRILKAKIQVSRSECKQALETLRGELPHDFSSTEIDQQRKLYQGIAHRCDQSFAEARNDFAEADAMAAHLPPRFKCQLLIARAALEFDEKEYEKAETSYKSAQSIAHSEKLLDLETNALGNLGRLAIGQRHFDQAIDINQSALGSSSSLGRKGDAATILGNIAWAHSELGDFENALKYYKQGAEASAESGLPGYSAYWFTGVANSYLALRQYREAEQLALKTLQDAYQLKNGQTTTECLNTLTEVMLKTGRLNEAKTRNEEALKMEESGSDKFGVPDTLIWAGHIATAEKRFGDADRFFNRVLSSLDPDDPPLRWQAEAGLAGVRAGEGKPAEAERLYLQAISTIEKARNSVGHEELRLSFLSSGIAVYGKYIDFLIRQNRPADALNQAELSRARTLMEGLSSDARSTLPSAKRVPTQQVVKRLHATLLFYWLGEQHSYLWVIRPNNTIYFTLPPSLEIDALVKAYTEAIVDSKDVLTTEDRQIGERLFATLIAPAQKLIPANSRVILLPDGSLYGLNFETLISPEPQPHYWIRDVMLTTGSSLTLLASAANRPVTREKNLLLVGNPKQANREFPPLLQAPTEMKRVEQYFPESRRAVLDGEHATPHKYLDSNPERYSYVHFSTHGTASRTRPLESAVVLSNEPGSDDYKLYARDIVTRPLHAELVTISACYGSGKRAYSGEGLVGLSWAFVRAGAHNVIGALWEVADAPATPDLMDTLYKELNQGKDPAAALREAKLKLLQSNNAFAKPFYWAPFQLYSGS